MIKSINQQFDVAVSIAVNAHYGQRDKQGDPYLLHVLRVMHSAETLEDKIVAVLHDVIEDTNVNVENLIDAGIDSQLVSAVIAITRDKSEPYNDYIKRVKMNPTAKRVKLIDIMDNASRLDTLAIIDPDLADRLRSRYASAYFELDFENING